MTQTKSNAQQSIPLPPSANPSADYAAAFAPVRPLAQKRTMLPRVQAQQQAEPEPARDRTRPFRMLALIVGFVLLVLYGTIAFTSEDLLWFIKRFDDKPVRIVVYHEGGKRTNLDPGDPDFEPLSRAILSSLSEGLARPSGIGFSDASLLDAYSRYVTVEAYFERPVKLHAWFHTGESTLMLFPITGRHSELSLVVLGRNGKYLASPPVLNTVEPLRETLRDLGYY